MLGASFIAIGYLVSASVRERGRAAGIAIGIWLLFVLIYDMALLGLLVADQGRLISAGALDALLLLNPTDIYRMFNIAGSANVSAFSGMAGLADTMTLSPMGLLAALAAWALVPLALAKLAFARKEL
jgi:Cu-processing system permease protein